MEDDTNNVPLDTPIETEEVDTESTGTDTEETDAPSEADVDVAKLQETNKRLFERAKKAEAEAKALKAAKPPTKPATQPAPKAENPSLSVEEAVLRANGMSPELLKELKAVATVRGTNLIDTQTDPIFVAVKEKFEKEQKQKEAALPASKGSGQSRPKKDVSSPGLSDAEHKRLVLEALGK